MADEEKRPLPPAPGDDKAEEGPAEEPKTKLRGLLSALQPPVDAGDKPEEPTEKPESELRRLLDTEPTAGTTGKETPTAPVPPLSQTQAHRPAKVSPSSAPVDEVRDKSPAMDTGSRVRNLLNAMQSAGATDKESPPASATPRSPRPQAEQPGEELPMVSPFVSDPLDVDDEAVGAGPQPPAPAKSEKVEKVEEAIYNLREKMATVATEFAEGKINRAQFEAIYARYQDQRAITESLLARDPETDAWQQVLSEGHTNFLRGQYEARIESYILFQHRDGRPLITHGHLAATDRKRLASIVSSLRSTPQRPPEAGIHSAPLTGGRWTAVVPGQYTTSVAIYSLEPAASELNMLRDLHGDFETANRRELAAGVTSPESLVYPQRALLEK